MEIERKFLIKKIPENLQNYTAIQIAQGYLCTSPVVRIRKWNDDYILTYKSAGLRTRVEEELPLTKDSFEHLKSKTDGNIIEKTRYLIPDENKKNTIELDAFHGIFEGIYLAEVEFESEQEADSYTVPSWFSEEVTYDGAFHNSSMSTLTSNDITKLKHRGTPNQN